MALTPVCLDLASRNWQNRLLRPHFTRDAIQWLSEVIEWPCPIIVTDTFLTHCGLYYIVDEPFLAKARASPGPSLVGLGSARTGGPASMSIEPVHYDFGAKSNIML